MHKPLPDAAKARAFVVYSRRDSGGLAELLEVLGDESIGQIAETRYDVMIQGGEEWERSIRAFLAEADLIIFLVSPHFDQSVYVTETELPLARERMAEGSARSLEVRINGHRSVHELPVGRMVDLKAADLRCQCKFAFYEAFEQQSLRFRGLSLRDIHQTHGMKPPHTKSGVKLGLMGGLINGMIGGLMQRAYFPEGVNGFQQILLFSILVCATGGTVAVMIQGWLVARRHLRNREEVWPLLAVGVMMLAVSLCASLIGGPMTAGVVWVIDQELGGFGATMMAFVVAFLQVLSVANRQQPTRLPIYWDLKKCGLRPDGGWFIELDLTH